MMAQPNGLVVFIQVLVLIKSNLLVRSVCLQDVLTFYYDENDAACKFNTDDFNNVFNDHTAGCQWFDCSVTYVSHPVMKTDETYEIERLIIQFFKTDEFILDKSCWKYDNKDVYVTVNCEAKYIQDRGIGESCFKDNQCARVTVNSACNQTTRVCQCKAGYLYLCETNSCSPERRLNETCDDDIQCSVVTPNSTCNNTTKVCECIEGHLELLNMCVHGRFLMNGISQHCKRFPLTIENMADKSMEQICIMYAEVFQSTSEEVDNNSTYGLVIGVGIAGLVLGIAMCGAVYFIMIRHRTKSQNRTNTIKEDINQPRSVEVSNAVMNSKPIHHKNERCDTSIKVENAIYNHLHEDPSEISMQPDYDHVPQLGTEDDDYSHLATCNSTNVENPGEYGVVN